MEAIKKIHTLGMGREEWLEHRKAGIGCSEVSAIMGLNPYQSSIELFYDKLGEIDPKVENVPMFMGNFMEDKVAELYQYWENDNDSVIKNYNAKKIINKVQRVNFILQNEKYPYLLGNLDRLQIKPYKCCVEIKTVSGYAIQSWENGIPPYFLAQVQSYMMITGLDLCKLCILQDGRYLEVYDVPANSGFQAHIAERCEEFWSRVTTARALKAEGKPYEHCEPEPDNSLAYENFMKKKYGTEEKPVTVNGDADTLLIAKKYNDCKEKLDELKEEQQLHKNKLIVKLKEISKIDFGLNIGYCSWKTNKSGSRVFKVQLKKEKEALKEPEKF